MNGRNLQPGDNATTDYNKGLITRIEIRERREQPGTQSGIQYRVFPVLHGGYPSTWYDADWFEPVAPNAELNGGCKPSALSAGLAGNLTTEKP